MRVLHSKLKILLLERKTHNLSLTHKKGLTKDKPFLFVSHFLNLGTPHHHITKYLRNWSTFWSGFENPDLWGNALF